MHTAVSNVNWYCCCFVDFGVNVSATMRWVILKTESERMTTAYNTCIIRKTIWIKRPKMAKTKRKTTIFVVLFFTHVRILASTQYIQIHSQFIPRVHIEAYNEIVNPENATATHITNEIRMSQNMFTAATRRKPTQFHTEVTHTISTLYIS